MANENENKLLRTNSIKIVGTLLDAQVKFGNRQDNGQGYVSVDATITANIKGYPCEYKVNFYTNQLTKEGKESKLYETYSKLPELKGRKVRVDGEIRENRYWSANLNQLVSVQLLTGRFVSGVVESTADEATFVLGGFIVKPLTERQNKNGDVYRYDIAVGQSNYNGDGMSSITLHVDPNLREIVSGVQNTYQVGDTVQFTGTLVFKVETVTVADENTAFGAPVVKTFTNRQSNFFIEGGSNPITDERAYNSDVITSLVNSYKAHDVELQSAGVSSSKGSNNAPVNPTPTKRQTSLI